MNAIKKLIEETEKWRSFHDSRGPSGKIEKLICNIRIIALKDALKVLAQ